MNAGIIGIILHQLPYQFRGVHTLADIAYVVNLVLFIVFSIIFLARFALYRSEAYHEITGDIGQLSLLACWPIAWLTLCALTSLCVSEAVWGGHAFTIVAYVMWWIGVGWTVATLLFILLTMIRHPKASAESGGQLPPMVLLPCVAVATLATTGGIIASNSSHISARMAVPVIIVSYLSTGIAMFLAIFLYTLVFYNLFSTGWPDPTSTPQLFILAGPMGQTSTALQVLGSAANTYGRFGGYNEGMFLTSSAAQPLHVAGIMFALLLWGMSTLYVLIAICAMAERAFQKQLSWSPKWNSIIFPLGVYTTSMIYFSIEMNGPTWKVLVCILIIVMVILFFVNLAFTTMGVAKGEILIKKENPRVEKSE